MKNQFIKLLTLFASLAMITVAQENPKPADSQKPQTTQAGQGSGQGAGQGTGQGRGQRQGGMGGGIAGTVTGISGNTITVKNLQGNTVTVKTSGDTRVRQGGDEGSLKDVKVGSTVMVRGQADSNGVIPAQMIVIATLEQLQMMQQFAGQGGGQGSGQGGGQVNAGAMSEQLGKTMVIGEIKAIDETKITVLMPNEKSITFEVDENTSFKKDNQSVTLADFKVGERIFVQGALNSAGTFVAKTMGTGGKGVIFQKPTQGDPGKPKQ